jgi:hypothetical protein
MILLFCVLKHSIHILHGNLARQQHSTYHMLKISAIFAS